jgi:transposase-like protein
MSYPKAVINMNCKYCQSKHIIKFGKYKDVQRYLCKDCNHKFITRDTIPKMQTPIKIIAVALNMHYEGMSLNEICKNLLQLENTYISKVTPYNWSHRFTKLATKEADKYQPQVGGVWVADEMEIHIKGKNVWLWELIDTKTRFLLASHLSDTRTSRDARMLMERAYKRSGKRPRIIYTDKLKAYLEGIERAHGDEIKHTQGSPLEIRNNTDFIERFHSTLKDRTKVMRDLKNTTSAKEFLDGWLIHYNFFRPHMSLRDRTPASAAGIKFPFRNWKDIVKQPYDKTARITIVESREPPNRWGKSQ